jgi:hypothetical protein
MKKNIFANRFGLVALLSVSLFASTAFAGNAPAPTQVVVTNTPAQPVPVVGLIKDSDAPARKPFQWDGVSTTAAGSNSFITVSTVPANQRLVIEQVSGWCQGMYGTVSMSDYQANVVSHYQWLPGEFANGISSPASTSIHFYIDPGATFSFSLNNWGNTQNTCDLSVSGYFVNLP